MNLYLPCEATETESKISRDRINLAIKRVVSMS